MYWGHNMTVYGCVFVRLGPSTFDYSDGLIATWINKGGTVSVEGVKVTLTHANHSSSAPDGTYAGESCGMILEVDRALEGDLRHLAAGRAEPALTHHSVSVSPGSGESTSTPGGPSFRSSSGVPDSNGNVP